MIHRRKGRKLKRTASHRKALLSNLSLSLIKNKKIKTTLAKAKELRTYVEPLINKSKIAYLRKEETNFGVHARRYVYDFLNDKAAVKTLFDEIAPRVSERNGGYTRVLKMGRRLGDGAEMAIIELVDYNTSTTGSTSDSDKTQEENPKVEKKKSAGRTSRKTSSKTAKSQKKETASDK